MFSAQEKQSIFVLVSIYFSRMIGVFIAIPILALYAEQMDGFTPMKVGIALGILGLTQALLLLPMGLLSDYWGRKKVLLIGFSLFTAGSIICADAQSLDQLIFGRAIQGMGAVAGVLLALTSELIRAENRSIAMAIIGGSIGLSFGIALVLGPWIASQYNFANVFWLCSILGAICILIIAIKVPSKNPTQSTEITALNQLNKSIVDNILSNRQLMHFNLSVSILHFMQMSLWLVIPLTLVKLGYSTNEHWQFYLYVIGTSFLITLPLIRLSETRLVKHNNNAMAFTIVSLGLLLMAIDFNRCLFILGLFLFFAGFCFLEAKLPSQTSQQCSEELRGATMGIFSTFQFLGLFAGGVGGGLLVTLFGGTILYWTCAVALLWSLYSYKRFPSESNSTIV